MSITKSPDSKHPLSKGTQAPAPAAFGFQRRQWFDMLARHCFADQRCLWPRAEEDGAALTLPLVDQGSQLSSLSNYYSFSYGPIIEGTSTPERQEALLCRIAAQLRETHQRISFYPLLDHDGTARLMRRAFASAGWIALLTEQNSNHVLYLNGRDFEAYWAGRPGPLRSSVKRKGRASPYGFAIHEQLTEPLWQHYLAVYATSWKNAEPWPEMVRAIAEDAAARGVLRLGVASEGDEVVAAQIWTIEGPTACIHKIAHDSAHDRKSPGTLLSHYMFRHMIDREKVEQIDYGTGNNAYKRDWMEQERSMLRLDCFNPRKAAMWLPALRTGLSRFVRRPG